MNEDPNQNMSKAQVAKWFGVTHWTISRWMVRESNAIPHRKLPTGRVVFILSEIKDWRDQSIRGAAMKKRQTLITA